MRSFLILLALLAVRPTPLLAAPCWRDVFYENETRAEKGDRVFIPPFENASEDPALEWVSYLFPLLLSDYLSLGKGLVPEAALGADSNLWSRPDIAREIARQRKAKFLILGRFSRAGGRLQVHVQYHQVAKNDELGRLSGEVEFPETRRVNDFLVEIASQSSRAFRKGKVVPKKIAPYRNETPSIEALRLYTWGRTALERGTPEGVREAILRFEGAMRQDFNYVHAYIGMAHALARQGFLEHSSGAPHRASFKRARVSLEKARLLKPHLVKKRASVIESYLAAETHIRLAGFLSDRGRWKEAAQELKKEISLLPGDLAAYQRLSEALDRAGQKKEAERHRREADRLNGCPGD